MNVKPRVRQKHFCCSVVIVGNLIWLRNFFFSRMIIHLSECRFWKKFAPLKTSLPKQKCFMKHYYYFFKDMQNFNRESVILKVAVGSSFSDGAKYSLVREYCKDCGFYFHKVSRSSDLTVDMLAKKLFPGSLMPRLRLRSDVVSISELYQVILDDSLDLFLSGITAPINLYSFLLKSDSKFFFKAKQAHKKKLPFPSVRKNLKSAWQRESVRVSVCFGLILALFVTSLLLDAWERQLMMY